ncbi:hypothetical protein HYT92_02970 [Candidatus Pacearchaeota archaeon]|nr:hypothetical protein [Candidatus Pacearchaeota archaeon]
MTLNNRIDQNELYATAGQETQRDGLLARAFMQEDREFHRGLVPERLNSIRTFEVPLYRRIEFAAAILSDALFEMGVSADEAIRQFTADNLAAIVNKSWNNPRKQAHEVKQAIERRHDAELHRKKARYNFDNLTALHLFREKVMYGGKNLYRGNLHKARGYWKKFQPSSEDFTRNINLPLSIGSTEVGILLGICMKYGQLERSTGTVTFWGKKDDSHDGSQADAYRGIVPHLFERVHNYQGFCGESQVFTVDSQAITTWLTDDLRYPYTVNGSTYRHKRVPFSQLLGKNTKIGFLSPLISHSKGIDEFDMRFEDGDKLFVRDILALMEMIGYSPSGIRVQRDQSHNQSPVWYFGIPKGDLSRILHNDMDTAFRHVGLLLSPDYSRLTVAHVTP